MEDCDDHQTVVDVDSLEGYEAVTYQLHSIFAPRPFPSAFKDENGTPIPVYTKIPKLG